jgi:hypothetical protein
MNTAYKQIHKIRSDFENIAKAVRKNIALSQAGKDKALPALTAEKQAALKAFVPGLRKQATLPAYIPDSCRKRTATLLIGLENYSDDQLGGIRETAEAIAGKVVEVPSLDDLAGIWATQIPRRQVA